MLKQFFTTTHKYFIISIRVALACPKNKLKKLIEEWKVYLTERVIISLNKQKDVIRIGVGDPQNVKKSHGCGGNITLINALK